jgi:hypothetical protein
VEKKDKFASISDVQAEIQNNQGKLNTINVHTTVRMRRFRVAIFAVEV